MRIGLKASASRIAMAVTIAVTVCGAAVAGASAEERRLYDIPAQPLTQALTAYARASGLKLAYAAALTGDRRSPSLKGEFTSEDALKKLLEGAGLAYLRDGDAVTIFDFSRDTVMPVQQSESVQLQEISVLGQGETATGPVRGFVARRSATASKTDAALIETPQSISVVTRDQIEAQGATTVGEALRYTPGVVTGTAGLQSRRFDPVFIRGFGGFSADAVYASYLDGLRWNFPARTAVQVDPFLLERVEVFKGPSSVLYGRATPGGFVNMVTKRPTEEPLHEVFARIGNHRYLETGIDVGGPVDDDGKFLYRMIALGRDARTQVDYQKDQRVLLAPSFTWRPTDRTTLTVQGVYQRDPRTSDAGFVSPRGTILGIPGGGKVQKSFFQGDKNWNRFSRTEAWIGAQLEHEFNDALTFRSNARYAKLKDTFKSVDFASQAEPNENDEVFMSRNATLSKHNIDNFGVDNQLEAKFATGPLSHTVLMGLDYQWMDGPWKYGFGGAPVLDIYDPDNNQHIDKPAIRFDFANKIKQTGVYVQDQIAFDKWRLWLSGRHDWSELHTTRTDRLGFAPLLDQSAKDKAFTGRAGLVYLFDNGLSPYVSYSTSFEPSLNNVSGKSTFDPTTGKQWEVGVKYQPPGYNAFITVAAFDIKKKNVATAFTDPNTGLPDVSVSGEVRSRGVEIEGKASLAEGLDVTASYAYVDIEVTKSVDDTKGKRPVGAPAHTAAIWADYAFHPSSALNGFTIGGGVRYTSSTYGTLNNVWGAEAPNNPLKASKVPGFTLVDAAISYDFGKRDKRFEGLSLTVNAKNLLNKSYIAACNGYGSCTFGEGRTVLATARYRW